MNRQTETEPLP